LADRSIRVEHVMGSQWKVTGGDYGVNATSTWGTTRMPAPRLAERLLRQAPIQVMDPVPDGPALLNPVATEAATEKAHLLNERFSDWCGRPPSELIGWPGPTTTRSTRSCCAATTPPT
jgi:N12 class adenine-specific DNA methylase